MIGGGGNSTLASSGGTSVTIYGGSGNETIYGGDGRDTNSPQVGGDWDAAGDNQQTGGNLLVAGNGNDVLFSDAIGKNTLVAGAGNDVLWAGGDGNPGDADYLAAGTGIDSLYGGPGNDTFQLQFGPTGQQPDVVVGGTGINSLILKPDAVDSPQLIDAVTSTTSTTLDVTDADALAGVNATNFVIQVDSEQMLVTNVSGDLLTVVRGYKGTVAATHSAGPSEKAPMDAGLLLDVFDHVEQHLGRPQICNGIAVRVPMQSSSAIHLRLPRESRHNWIPGNAACCRSPGNRPSHSPRTPEISCRPDRPRRLAPPSGR